MRVESDEASVYQKNKEKINNKKILASIATNIK